KHLLDYDDVMNRQRELIYGERDLVLKGSPEELKKHVLDMVGNVLERLILTYINPDIREENKDPEGLITVLGEKFGPGFREVVEKNLDDMEALLEALEEKVGESLALREREFGPERMQYLVRYILLQVIDTKWKEHLYGLDNLREGIGLRAYGQRNPLVEYKREAFDMFDQMTDSVKEEAVELLFRVQAVREVKPANPVEDPKAQYLHPEAGTSEKLSDASSRMPRGMGASSPFSPRNEAPDNQAPTPIKRSLDKVGRNDPCICGSGKKYKKCCGANE
ncbi:MAG: preprotein translocase subunit SecA, partial [Synergistales bacterium]|nr:preprotein translocase subunit SecA [Synergistales bacterium]